MEIQCFSTIPQSAKEGCDVSMPGLLLAIFDRRAKPRGMLGNMTMLQRFKRESYDMTIGLCDGELGIPNMQYGGELVRTDSSRYELIAKFELIKPEVKERYNLLTTNLP